MVPWSSSIARVSPPRGTSIPTSRASSYATINQSLAPVPLSPAGSKGSAARPAGAPAGPAGPSRPAAGAAGAGNQGLPMGEGSTLLQRLGAGQFGEVYRALAPGGVEVAVKRIFRSVDDEASRRELHALELIRSLRHPFLLQTQAFW